MKKVKLSSGREVEVRELKMKDVREALQVEREIDQTFLMVSSCSGLSLQELDELNIDDFMLLQNALGKSVTTLAK